MKLVSKHRSKCGFCSFPSQEFPFQSLPGRSSRAERVVRQSVSALSLSSANNTLVSPDIMQMKFPAFWKDFRPIASLRGIWPIFSTIRFIARGLLQSLLASLNIDKLDTFLLSILLETLVGSAEPNLNTAPNIPVGNSRVYENNCLTNIPCHHSQVSQSFHTVHVSAK